MLERTLPAAMAATIAVISAPAGAHPLVDSTNLRNAVTIENIRGHQRELQRIANRNGGTRASGTPGYDASVDYVVGQLPAGAYSITRQVFEFAFFQELSDRRAVAGRARSRRLRPRRRFRHHGLLRLGAGGCDGNLGRR